MEGETEDPRSVQQDSSVKGKMRKLLSSHMSVTSGNPCLSHLESLEFQGCVSFAFGSISNDL